MPKVVTGTRFPLQHMRRAHRGLVVFQLFRGQLIAKGWPRKRGPAGTQAQMIARADFTRMVRAVQDMLPSDHSAAVDIAKGSSWTWRDVLSRAVTGQLVELENYWMVATPFILDSISDVIGAMLVRTEAGWVGLLPGEADQVLTLVAGLPQWETLVFPATGISQLHGDAAAGPGAGDQAITLSPSGVVAGTYTVPSLTIDAKGRVTGAASGSGSAGGGLYGAQMSAPPTGAFTGLTTWLNQGTASVANSAPGLVIADPSNAGAFRVRARTKPAPATPYTITALVSLASFTNGAYAGIGWYDGTAKLHLLGLNAFNGLAVLLGKLNSVSSYNSNDAATGVGAPAVVWLRIGDDGTNITAAYSIDGVNFVTLLTRARSAAWLGAAGYTNVCFFLVAQSADANTTLLSWN